MKRSFVATLIVVMAAPAVSSGQSAGASAPRAAEDRRHSIRLMEAVLSRAVLGGAEHLAEQLGSGNPNVSFFTGQARARGFVLDGYGLFFHVEIPEMQQSLVMSIRTLDRDLDVANALQSLRRFVGSVPDGAQKLQAEQAIKRLELQVGPVPELADPTASAGRPFMRSAETTVSETLPAEPLATLRDPNAAYRAAIRSALIDAMLDHSRGLNLHPDEWLSVAAHRGDSPLAPNEIVTSSTLVLRIKGSDLALYDVDRARKEEIRARVEVKEF